MAKIKLQYSGHGLTVTQKEGYWFTLQFNGSDTTAVLSAGQLHEMSEALQVMSSLPFAVGLKVAPDG